MFQTFRFLLTVSFHHNFGLPLGCFCSEVFCFISSNVPQPFQPSILITVTISYNVCPLILHPTSPTFLPFKPLPVSFAHLLTALSSVCLYSILWSKVFRILRPFYLELFLNMSAPLILSLLSDLELKLTSSVLSIISLNLSVSAIYQLCCC